METLILLLTLATADPVDDAIVRAKVQIAIDKAKENKPAPSPVKAKDSYTEAVQEALKSGKHLVVSIGTEISSTDKFVVYNCKKFTIGNSVFTKGYIIAYPQNGQMFVRKGVDTLKEVQDYFNPPAVSIPYCPPWSKT